MIVPSAAIRMIDMRQPTEQLGSSGAITASTPVSPSVNAEIPASSGIRRAVPLARSTTSMNE